jgi:hypothetical protein
MAKTIKINGVTYEAKQIDVPLASDTSKMATFHDTTDAGAKAASVKFLKDISYYLRNINIQYPFLQYNY